MAIPKLLPDQPGAYESEMAAQVGSDEAAFLDTWNAIEAQGLRGEGLSIAVGEQVSDGSRYPV